MIHLNDRTYNSFQAMLEDLNDNESERIWREKKALRPRLSVEQIKELLLNNAGEQNDQH